MAWLCHPCCAVAVLRLAMLVDAFTYPLTAKNGSASAVQRQSRIGSALALLCIAVARTSRDMRCRASAVHRSAISAFALLCLDLLGLSLDSENVHRALSLLN